VTKAWRACGPTVAARPLKSLPLTAAAQHVNETITHVSPSSEMFGYPYKPACVACNACTRFTLSNGDACLTE